MKMRILERAMKTLTLIMGLFLFTMITQSLYAQQSPQPPTETIKTAASHTPEQQEVIDLSNMKWDWMADKKIDSLEALFDDKAMFTHMGGPGGKPKNSPPSRAAVSGTKKLWFTQLMLAHLVTQPSC